MSGTVTNTGSIDSGRTKEKPKPSDTGINLKRGKKRLSRRDRVEADYAFPGYYADGFVGGSRSPKK